MVYVLIELLMDKFIVQILERFQLVRILFFFFLELTIEDLVFENVALQDISSEDL